MLYLAILCIRGRIANIPQSEKRRSFLTRSLANECDKICGWRLRSFYKSKFHLAPHVTSRHDTLPSPCILAYGKVVKRRFETWRACRTTRRDTLVTTSVTGARHVFRGVATVWTVVDISTSLFPEVVPEIDTMPENKILNLYTRKLLLFRRALCWNNHCLARSTRRTCRVVTRRDVTSQV